MPRDLFSPLSPDRATGNAGYSEAKNTNLPALTRDGGATRIQSAELHPYAQALGLSDVDSCVVLENAAFPPQERCSREKFEYRFKACSGLSLGLFSSVTSFSHLTSHAALPVESRDPKRKAVLLAHIVATKATGRTVTDQDMAMPDPQNPDRDVGHKEEGRTVCIHSLAVLPECQKKGLGTMLMKAYLDRIRSSGVADSVAIIAHDHLISYYEQLGFVSLGASQAQFGGGGWFDMELKL